MNQRQIFQQYLAQTSEEPMCLEIIKAQGNYLFDPNGKAYLDLIGGISVCNVGHSHPKVIEAIKKQSEQYMHIMVYGELIQTPQIIYAELLINHLPESLNSVYFTNSGAEAVEGAMKLAKRVTGRSQIFAFKNSYHGSTQGALSIIGDEYWRTTYRPLLPDIHHFDYNKDEIIDAITEQTACIIMEPIQAEAGVIKADIEWIKKISEKCTQNGTLLILDEIQTGFGRTGSLFAFEQFNIVPDILLLGKALGGGMPMGAFIADRKLMDTFASNPILGHMTTFGGHPVCCAAGKAAMELLLENDFIKNVKEKEHLFLSLLKSENIQKITSAGLMMAIHLDSFELAQKAITACLSHKNAVFTDWFLFASNCIRIAPPLTITEEEIKIACNTLNEILDKISSIN